APLPRPGCRHRRPASSLKTPRRAAVGPGRGRGPGEADCLLRYAGRMPGHEVPYFEHPEKLEFPTEVWAARELRRANVLRLAIVLVEGLQGPVLPGPGGGAGAAPGRAPRLRGPRTLRPPRKSASSPGCGPCAAGAVPSSASSTPPPGWAAG